MGQQQLILLVLATIIVGLAIIVGIRAYSENSNKAAVDAMMQDATRIANDAQSWHKRPAAMGGPGVTAGTINFASATLKNLGYPTTTNVNTYVNENGTCVGTPVAASLTIVCTGVENTGNVIQVVVDGLSPGDIEGSITSIAN